MTNIFQIPSVLIYNFKQLKPSIKSMIEKEKKLMEQFPEKLCFEPSYNGRNFTNRVLYQQFKEQITGRITYYCPAYLRIKIKNFTSLSHEDLQAGINVNIILTINCRGIKPLIESKIKSLLRISFNRDDSLKVEQSAHNIKPDCNGVYTYIITMSVHVAMNPDIFMSPFQILNLLMSISIQNIQLNKQTIKQVIHDAQLQIYRLKMQKEIYEENEKKQHLQHGDNVSNEQIILRLEQEIQELRNTSSIFVCFNLMNTGVNRLKINYTSEGTFGNYDLVESGLAVQYTNHSVNHKVREKKIKKLESKKVDTSIDFSLVRPFNYAHFQIPLYKFPMVTVATIFIPLWLLGIITIGIYFQDDVLVDRLISLSALLIAFMQIISVIREQLPPSPHVSLLQMLTYAQIIGTCLLCLLESIQKQLRVIDSVFEWQKSWHFILSALVLIGQFVIVIALIIIHKCLWQPRYNKQPSGQKEAKFNHKKWQNTECQKHFRRKIDNKIIKIKDVDERFEAIKQFLICLTEEQKQQIEEKMQEQQSQFWQNLQNLPKD